MKKYLIRKHCEATPLLPIGIHDIQDYYYGDKNGYLTRDLIPTDNLVRLYGYDSIEEAKPVFDTMVKAAEEETKRGKWKTSVTIEEIEVE